jgi:hypothetical protein
MSLENLLSIYNSLAYYTFRATTTKTTNENLRKEIIINITRIFFAEKQINNNIGRC